MCMRAAHVLSVRRKSLYFLTGRVYRPAKTDLLIEGFLETSRLAIQQRLATQRENKPSVIAATL